MFNVNNSNNDRGAAVASPGGIESFAQHNNSLGGNKASGHENFVDGLTRRLSTSDAKRKPRLGINLVIALTELSGCAAVPELVSDLVLVVVSGALDTITIPRLRSS